MVRYPADVMWSRALALPLPFALLACTGEAPDADPVGETGTDSDSAVEWPSGEVASPTATLVIDGALAANGDIFRVTTGPSGLSDPIALSAVVTNRSSSSLAFDGAWLSGDGWALASDPPGSLAPEESATFEITFDPVNAAGASEWAATLSVPGTDTHVTLVADVPGPLRLVITGNGGWTAWSDDYGATFTDSGAPADLSLSARAVTWGGGRFFRADVSGDTWFDLGTYAWSEDGESWTTSTVAEEFWASDCTYGLDHFVCLRGGVLSWSESGGTVVHEPTDYSNLLNDIGYADGVFVAVGRDGRRVLSEDGLEWSYRNTYSGADELRALAYGDGRWVAVGGYNRFVASVSTDGGYTWTETGWGESDYASLYSIAYSDGLFLAQALSNEDLLLWRSTDGLTWEGVEGLGRWDRYVQIGAAAGWFFAQMDDAIYRSRDGSAWELVHTPPDGVTPRMLAMEGG